MSKQLANKVKIALWHIGPFCDREIESDGKCENAERENIQQETRGGSGEPTHQPQRCVGDPALFCCRIVVVVKFAPICLRLSSLTIFLDVPYVALSAKSGQIHEGKKKLINKKKIYVDMK